MDASYCLKILPCYPEFRAFNVIGQPLLSLGMWDFLSRLGSES